VDCIGFSLSCGWWRAVSAARPIVNISVFFVFCVQPEEIGDYFLVQQQTGCCPLSVFKIPACFCLCAQSCIKVWTCCSDPGLCKPPCDLVFRQLMRFSVGANIMTMLVDPCGKVIQLLIRWSKGSFMLVIMKLL
jgi:hypothetical protein